jgi:hypothetical protein
LMAGQSLLESTLPKFRRPSGTVVGLSTLCTFVLAI